MSYFPILTAPYCTGWTTLSNFAPNNWEASVKRTMNINLSWAHEGFWHSRLMGTLESGAMRTVFHKEVVDLIPDGVLPLLSLSPLPLLTQSERLPKSTSPATLTPAWRATLGLVSAHASTCYQGEADPFPSPGSLLSFPPFLQISIGVENYMLFLNIETKAASRSGRMEIYDASKPEAILCEAEVRNNSLNVIRLDGLGLQADSLPLILCRQMSGIPLYFSALEKGRMLSLEHTHPPASYVIHGKRWEAQKIIKNLWFAKAGAP
jgi:hypothetical protein